MAGKDSTAVNPFAGSPSIEEGIDEAMRPVVDDGVGKRIIASKATALSSVDKERPYNCRSRNAIPNLTVRHPANDV